MKYINGVLPGTGSYIYVLLWFLIVLYLGYNGILIKDNGFFLTNVQILILLPILIFWTSFLSSKKFKEYIFGLDILFLNAVQCFRIFGGSILIIWGYGLLPGGFAIPMSVLDMSVGFTALYTVYYTANSLKNWEKLTFLMNTWGYLDFIITIILVFIGGKLSIDPPINASGYTQLNELPLSLFPTFAIGFFSCCNFAAILKVKSMKKESIKELNSLS